MEGQIPQTYDDASFDPVRNAQEAGYENVPLYYAEPDAGAGSTDRPSINLTSSGNIVKQGVPWLLVILIIGLFLWMRK
jgi:hypothetical protein